MRVDLTGQAKRMFDGLELGGTGWDELMVDAWGTLDWIRRGCDPRLGPDAHGKRAGFVYQYVRKVADPGLPVSTSKEGIGYVLTGIMRSPDHVVYHQIKPWTMKQT